MNDTEVITAGSKVGKDKPNFGSEQLAGRIKSAVRRATGGRIHNLAVRVTGTHIVLDGFCSSYHCFQLAQQGAMKSSEDLLVDNQIEVL